MNKFDIGDELREKVSDIIKKYGLRLAEDAKKMTPVPSIYRIPGKPPIEDAEFEIIEPKQLPE